MEERPAVKRSARAKRRVASALQATPAVIKRNVDSSTQKATLYPWRQTLALLTQIARDRGRERDADLARQALYIGSLFVCIQDGPGPDGLYGGVFTSTQVADQIRSYVSGGADWLAQQGQPISAGGGALASLLELLGQQQIHLPARPAQAFDAYTVDELAGAEDIMISDGMELGLGEEDLAPL